MTNLEQIANVDSLSQEEAIKIANCFDGNELLYRQQSSQQDYINKQIQGYCLCDATTCKYYSKGDCNIDYKRNEEELVLFNNTTNNYDTFKKVKNVKVKKRKKK